MKIKEFSQHTGLSAKTIRYYEEIGLLPTPARAKNNYREYGEQDVERVRLVAGARRLDLSLNDIQEVLDLRDHHEVPCRVLLERIEKKANEIAERIHALQKMEYDLRELHSLGMSFPVDDIDEKNCICHLVSEQLTKKE